MLRKNNLVVTLSNDSLGKFYTGDIVTSMITLELEETLKVESFYLEVVGISKASWTRASPTAPYLKIYSEKKKIFYIKFNSVFIEAYKSDMLMQAGFYSHAFHFALPHDLPSSFRSSIANVYYYIKISSKPAYNFSKIVPFVVVSNVNLNTMDNILIPCAYEFQRYFRSKAANLIIRLKTYRAFAPMQIIPIEITLENEKNIKIKKIKISLIQKIHYSVSSGHADDKIHICKINYTKINSTISQVCKMCLEIPQIIPTSINVTEPMIDISYDLRMEAYFSYHLNLIESIPVTVAAVPVIHKKN